MTYFFIHIILIYVCPKTFLDCDQPHDVFRNAMNTNIL